MNIHHDFQELLQLLTDHHVEYMIVGGYAVTYHGFVRLTKDLDVFYQLTPENTQRLKKALTEFGFTSTELDTIKFELGMIVSFGVPPLRVDFINSIDGVTFDDAMGTRIKAKYGDAIAFFIGKNFLIQNKLASARPQDIVDVAKLA